MFFEVGDDLLAGFEPVKAMVGRFRQVDVRGRVHDIEVGEIVALADGEVVGIVGWRHLHGTGAELGFGPVVGDNRNLATDQRQLQKLADHRSVALVCGIYGDGDVAQHGLGTGGGNDDGSRPVCEGVTNLIKLAELLLMDNFKVGDGGLAAGTPVHDVGTAVDQSLLVKTDERLAHGYGQDGRPW